MALKVINWEEAFNQVGGDKDFLNEVLDDLLTESAAAQEEISKKMNLLCLIRSDNNGCRFIHRRQRFCRYRIRKFAI